MMRTLLGNSKRNIQAIYQRPAYPKPWYSFDWNLTVAQSGGRATAEPRWAAKEPCAKTRPSRSASPEAIRVAREPSPSKRPKWQCYAPERTNTEPCGCRLARAQCVIAFTLQVARALALPIAIVACPQPCHVAALLPPIVVAQPLPLGAHQAPLPLLVPLAFAFAVKKLDARQLGGGRGCGGRGGQRPQRTVGRRAAGKEGGHGEDVREAPSQGRGQGLRIRQAGGLQGGSMKFNCRACDKRCFTLSMSHSPS
jgi:hypothetical protein